jgi:hypothetical protein
MKRIQDQEKGPREKKVEAKPAAPVAPVQVKTTAVQPVKRAPAAARQVSEDDEIARIKRENKAAGTSAQSPTAVEPVASILKKAVPASEDNTTDVSQVLPTNVFDLYVCCLFLSRTLFLDVTNEIVDCNNKTNGRSNKQRKFISGEFK